MIAFIIWSFVALLFLAIGIRGWKSKEAIGFFTFMKPPLVRDVNRYNHSVSMIWIIASGIFELLGIPFLFIKQNSPLFILVIFGVVALVIGMMIVYIRIETKYKE